MVTEVNDCKIAVLSRIYGEMKIIHGQMNSLKNAYHGS